jgi:hypothetical protein
MNPEPESAADVVRNYVSLWQGICISGEEAAAMARELRAYAAATEDVRASLSPSDQPANFARALAAAGPAIDEVPT